ncbi:putative membrane protein [Oopsacas minuta]|uniref:Membrane protein n=1 Tax=Oopsacas minuta TaxID=111878 RepID=A0AAV7JL82_9METZ|nr:putative membrane protein [Oopsacas minuta]
MFGFDYTQVSSYLEEVCYGGLNKSLVSQGGRACAEYLPYNQKIYETMITTIIMSTASIISWKTIKLPKIFPKDRNPLGQRILLLSLGFVFGIETGYKIASRKLLFFLNPCHMLTVLQLLILASKPGRVSFAMLRIMLHYVYGAFIAVFLAHMEGRYFYGEFISFWCHHILIAFIVPPYMVYTWGPDSLEPITNLGWNMLTGIIFGIHHHYVLQPLGALTHVNLNYILCPAERDPFRGQYYRFAAIFHQTFALFFLGKIYGTFIRYVIIPILPKIDYFAGEHDKKE